MSRGVTRGVKQLGLLLGVLLCGTAALAQEEYPSLGFKMMNSSQNPFPFYVDGRNTKPAGIDLAAVETAAKNAAQTWENVSCAYSDFDYKGLSTSNSQIVQVDDPNDRFNVSAVWVTSKTDPSYLEVLGGGSDASAAVPLAYSGALYQCDILLNAVDFRWSTVTPTPAGYMDLESVLLREFGRCQGLATIVDPADAVMYRTLEPGQSRRALTQHDIDHVCTVLPQAGAVGSPCPAGTCTNGLTCASTQAPDGTTVKLCTKGCSQPADCADPYTCRASTAVSGFTNACLPPTSATTQVGKDCGSASTCGSARAVCEAPVDYPSGSTAWQAGYCTQSCATGQPACPAGSGCSQVAQGGGKTEALCLKTCRVGGGDCRDGYSCAVRPEGNFCFPDCNNDADCNLNGGTDSVCRVCDHVCIPRVQSGRSVGETCLADSECAQGDVCLRYTSNSYGVCARPCALTACGCPVNTACQPVGTRGERLCVSNCTTFSCPEGTQCTPSGEGTACLPPSACTADRDCPSPFRCSLTGKCFDPALLNADAGTCSLGCPGGNTDAGTQPPPTPEPTDGGTGTGASGPGGCGCQGAPASAMAFFAALALLLVLKGKRNWHRP